MEHHLEIILGIVIFCITESKASLFSDECYRHAFASHYDPITDSCWIAEKTTLTYAQAKIRCNHMPGYDGHLGFPMTVNQSSFISPNMSAANSWIGLQHIGSSGTIANKNEWFWVYPNGSTISAATAPFVSGQPGSTNECALVGGGSVASLTSTPCNSATVTSFVCQYDRSTAHHETQLEHKCKQLNNWFWWSDDHSCVTLYDGIERFAEYASLACTEIPGYSGQLAHVTTVEKMTSLITLIKTIAVATDPAMTGLQRDLNVPGAALNGSLYWVRDDGYKLKFNYKEFSSSQISASTITTPYWTLYSPYFRDDTPNTNSLSMCEYTETLRTPVTDLQIKCANIPNSLGSSYRKLYYKDTCYVRDTVGQVYNLANVPSTCTHIPGYKGQLAVLRSQKLGNIIYQMFTKSYNLWWGVWVGLQRFNGTAPMTADDCTHNCTQYWYWTDKGKQYPSNIAYDNWATNYPAVSSGDCVFLGYNQLENWSCTGATWPTPALCEYSEPTKGTKYEIAALLTGMKTAAAAIISKYDDLPAFEMCAYQCTKDWQCRSFVHNQATKQCLLQASDSYDSTAKPCIYGTTAVQAITVTPVVASGYVWYDKV